MEKQTKNLFNKNYYLLGIRKHDGAKMWLEEASFDCGWYWGIGYVEVFNKSYTDIEEHTHFDSLFLSGNIYNSFKEYFEVLTIEDSQVWELLELMQSLYTLRKYSDFLTCGSSRISNNKFKNKIINNEEIERINRKLIPEILEEIYKMLGE